MSVILTESLMSLPLTKTKDADYAVVNVDLSVVTHTPLSAECG